MKILQLQTHVYKEKEKNLKQLASLLAEHCPAMRPDLVMLGEMFACPYDNRFFPVYAEPDGGDTQQFLAELAARHGIYLAAGSVPEKDEAGHIPNYPRFPPAHRQAPAGIPVHGSVRSRP